MKVPEELSSVVPCRFQELSEFLNFFCYEGEPVPECLFLCGHKSSGKSFTLLKVLQFLNISYAQVDCVEGYLPRLLFESIIAQLFGKDYSETKCDDLMSFINVLNRAAADEMYSLRTNVIILQRSERLRDMSPNILPALLRLREFCSLQRVCVILTSTIVWEKFIPPGSLPPPLQIYFQSYSQAEIVQILSLTRPHNYPENFYLKFLNLVVAVFYKYCCDLCELRYKASMIFPKYCEPIIAGKLQMDDSSALYKNVLPLLKSSVQTLYSRIDIEKKHNTFDTEIQERSPNLSSSAKLALSFELPYYAKYLLIAAYLASYNSSKEDKKLFVKHTDKTRRRIIQKRKDSKVATNALMMGPKHFDLERLLAIFFSIVEEKPNISVNLLSQVSSLVELQLLCKVGTDSIECPKYKCVVGLDFILNISRTVGFTITKFLICYK